MRPQALPPPLAPHAKTLKDWINKYLVPCTELLRLELDQPVTRRRFRTDYYLIAT